MKYNFLINSIVLCKMYPSIGKLLGSVLAHAEFDLFKTPDDLEALERIRLISEAYRNLSSPEFGSFKDEFQQGYEFGASSIREHHLDEPTPHQEKANPNDQEPGPG